MNPNSEMGRVVQATSLCRRATSPAERRGCGIPNTTRQKVRTPSSFRAASCRAERAGCPFHPWTCAGLFRSPGLRRRADSRVAQVSQPAVSPTSKSAGRRPTRAPGRSAGGSPASPPGCCGYCSAARPRYRKRPRPSNRSGRRDAARTRRRGRLRYRGSARMRPAFGTRAKHPSPRPPRALRCAPP